MPFLQASSRFSPSTTMCWYIGTKYWRSITNLGIGISSGWVFQRLDPHTLLHAGVGIWSAASEGRQSELGEAFLAGGLVRDVTLKRIIGDAADRGELIDHQSYRRVVGSAHFGLMLA